MFALVICYCSIVDPISGFDTPEVTNGYDYPSRNPRDPDDANSNYDLIQNEPVYLPPAIQTTTKVTSGQFYSSSMLRVSNMSCSDSSASKFFRVAFRVASNRRHPVVEDSVADCVNGGAGGDYYLEATGIDAMLRCGVRYCSKTEPDLCALLRIPSVDGIKLPEDRLVVLKCRPQLTVASGTKLLRLNPQKIQGRSLSAIASGGTQRNFDMSISIYRKAAGGEPDDFSRLVTSGDTVTLGDELLLKASVRDGDGWKHSRIGDVVMRRVLSRQQQLSRDSVTLIDSYGCRIPAMKIVCPEESRKIDPLTTVLPFRAFLFQGSTSAEGREDEMVLSVRMMACLHEEDCTSSRICEEKITGRTRAKRETSAENHVVTNHTESSSSSVKFRVIFPESTSSSQHLAFDDRNEDNGDVSRSNSIVIITFGIVPLITALIILSSVFLLCKFYKHVIKA